MALAKIVISKLLNCSWVGCGVSGAHYFMLACALFTGM